MSFRGVAAQITARYLAKGKIAMRRLRGFVLWGSCVLFAHDVSSAEAPTNRPVSIWSEGIRLAGNLWLPAGHEAGERVPGLLLVHGWGGVKAHLNAAYAPQFSALGMAVLTFDYRGWGDSEGARVRSRDGKITEVRELTDPRAFLEDIRNALAYLMGEPSVEADRLAIWGTSLGGGLAVHTAAEFPQIKTVIVQIGSVNTLAGVEGLPDDSPLSQASVLKRRIGIARGDLPPFPGDESKLPGLRGAMDWGEYWRYDPFSQGKRIVVPTLIIDARDEELFDIAKNGAALYEALKDKTTARYERLPGKHYDLYQGPSYTEAMKLETAWFTEFLKRP